MYKNFLKKSLKKRNIWMLTALSAALILGGCGKDASEATELEESDNVWETLPAQDSASVSDTETGESTETMETPEESHEGMYRSELTNEWIDESLKDQRPVAVVIDNESIALPHYGLTQADVVYEIMNSTANNRITRLMAIVKDYEKIEQMGSIRSARPTNFMLAAEWNAIIIHDGGPFYIEKYVEKNYTNNLSGGFARFSNGKKSEFTEYVTYDSYQNPTTGKSYDGLKQRLEASNHSITYNQYYDGPVLHFADVEFDFSGRELAENAAEIKLPFPHNSSTLKYNESTGTYDYYEYGDAHLDPGNGNAQLSFKNVILQKCEFNQLDENGYLIYNCIVNDLQEGYYITNGKAIPIKWLKTGESNPTQYVDATTGEELELNTGKTYISLVPSDGWKNLQIN